MLLWTGLDLIMMMIVCVLHLQQAIFMIPTKPPPSFRDPDKWSPQFSDFVSKCLVKNPEQRISAKELLKVCYTVLQLSIYLHAYLSGIAILKSPSVALP